MQKRHILEEIRRTAIANGGAALGAIGALLFGGGLAITNAAALGGALAAIAIVFALSFRSGDWNVHRLLLTGVVLSAGFGGVTAIHTIRPSGLAP